jgi:hypothetical protein
MNDNADVSNAISAHLSHNRGLLRLIEEKGFNTDEPRLIECHFWSPDESSARNLSAELEKHFFTELRIDKNSSGVWNLEMAVHQTASFVASEEFTTRITNTAARFRCVYDGWGTAL